MLGGFSILRVVSMFSASILFFGSVLMADFVADRDLQGKAWTTYVDWEGRTHDVYCFSDNYDDRGAYTCGV